MSANLDLVRSIRAALGRGEYGSADWADPEIAFVMTDGLHPGSGRGWRWRVQQLQALNVPVSVSIRRQRHPSR
jgi:hypothetical protein